MHAVDVVLRQRPIALAKGHHYQLRFKAHATAPTKVRARLSKISVPYTELWARDGRRRRDREDVRRRRTTATADDDSVELAIEFGGPLTGKAAADRLPRRRRAERSAVRGARSPQARAGADRAREPGRLPARLREDRDRGDQGDRRRSNGSCVDKGGKVRASGKTRPFGEDKSSGESVQQIDFSSFNAPGKGYKLKVGQGREPAVRHRHRRLQAPEARRAGVLLPAAQRRPDQDAVRRDRRRTSAPPATRATRACPARRKRSATTAWTSAAAGTTPATTASTWSTAASRSGRCRTSTRR